MPDTPDPHVEAIITHGVPPVDKHGDEEGALILDCTWSASRDEITHKGDNHADVYSEFRNPTLRAELNLRPRIDATGSTYGLGNAHPGQAVSGLVNLAEGRDIFGFSVNADMTIIATDPKRTSNDEGLNGSLTLTVKPFTLSASGIAALTP